MLRHSLRAERADLVICGAPQPVAISVAGSKTFAGAAGAHRSWLRGIRSFASPAPTATSMCGTCSERRSSRTNKQVATMELIASKHWKVPPGREDSSCYHKALAPLDRDRLMLQIRYQ